MSTRIALLFGILLGLQLDSSEKGKPTRSSATHDIVCTSHVTWREVQVTDFLF